MIIYSVIVLMANRGGRIGAGLIFNMIDAVLVGRFPLDRAIAIRMIAWRGSFSIYIVHDRKILLILLDKYSKL